MYKTFDFELSIAKYDIESKTKLVLILEILNKYDGLITDASENEGFIGFDNLNNLENANYELYKIGVCSNIWIEGVRK